MLLKRGAEAELTRTEWHGRPAVEKTRLPKSYRHPTLDDNIRNDRLRTEARLMAAARGLGVSVPILYDLDLAAHRIVMEFVDAPTVKAVLQERSDGFEEVPGKVGALVGTLHGNGVVHGDLTTSNLLWREGRIVAIDFSMGGKTESVESQGVDLRLLKEAWTSAHFEILDAFEDLLQRYRQAHPKAEEAIAKLREIEERGRYT